MASPDPVRFPADYHSTGDTVKEYLASQGASLTDPCSAKCVVKLPDWEDVLPLFEEVSKLNGAFKSAFSKATSNSERLRLVTADDVIIKQVNEHVTLLADTLSGGRGCICHRKVEAFAIEHASCVVMYGLEKYLKNPEQRHLRMFQLLTYGLMGVPHLSVAAAMLYEKRSGTSWVLWQHENALEDVERLLACEGMRESTKVADYLLRKASVLIVLGEHEKAAAFLASRPAGTPQAGTPEGDRWEKMVHSAANGYPKGTRPRTVPLTKFHDTPPVIEKLEKTEEKFTSHDRFSWLNAKLDLTFDAVKGRFQLVSREKLQYGDIVAIGKPFASLGGFQLDSVYDKCHHCSLAFPRIAFEGGDEDEYKGNGMLAIQGLPYGPARMPAPLPCTVCPNAVYCSEACRAEAWTLYHRFECSQLLALGKLDPAAHLALRMLYSAGSLEKIRQVAEKWDTVQDKLELIASSRSYAFIYSMRQPEIRNVEEEFRHTLTALFLAKLATMSGFISATSDDDVSFAAAILLRHLRQIKANVYVPRKGEPEGVSLSCLTSTMDFSCEPTVGYKSLFEGGSMLSNVAVFYAARAIEASSPLTLAYGTPYFADYLVSSFDHQSTRFTVMFASFEQSAYETVALRLLKMFGEADRWAEVSSQYGITCKCTRCQREMEDSPCSPGVTYLPLACPVCGRVMTRSKSDASAPFVCSMTACTGQMSLSQMSISYGKILKLTRIILPALLSTSRRTGHLSEEVALTLTRKLADELSQVVPLLSRSSSQLALLYSRLSVLLVHSSGARDGHLSITFLKEAFLYLEKCLSICESLDGGDGSSLDNGPVVNCLNYASMSVGLAIGKLVHQRGSECIRFCGEEGPHRCIIKQWLQARFRLVTAKVRTAYDLVLTDVEFVPANVATATPLENPCQMAG